MTGQGEAVAALDEVERRIRESMWIAGADRTLALRHVERTRAALTAASTEAVAAPTCPCCGYHTMYARLCDTCVEEEHDEPCRAASTTAQDAKPTILTPEVEAEVRERTEEMRRAHGAALGANYVIYGQSPLSEEAQEILAEIDRGDTERIHRLMDEDPLPAQDAEGGEVEQLADCIENRAAVVYPTDIFIKPTSEQYAEINALLKRERGHQLDGIAADVMRRAHAAIAAEIREGGIWDYEPDRAVLDRDTPNGGGE